MGLKVEEHVTIKEKRYLLSRQLNNLIDTECNGCDIREMKKQEGETEYLHYCMKECPVGKKLKTYGDELIKLTNEKRKHINIEYIIDDQQAM